MAGSARQEKKALLFLKKKQQKNFDSFGLCRRPRPGPDVKKSFLVLFFKKNGFFSLAFPDHKQPRAVSLFDEVERVMPLIGGGAGDIGEGVGAAQADQEDFAGGHCVEGEAGAHEGHRAGFGRDIDGFAVGWEGF
jgi:hypothetical protein